MNRLAICAWMVAAHKPKIIRALSVTQGRVRQSGQSIWRSPFLIVLGLTLSGCAAHTWEPGPGMSAADFAPAKARCSLLARHGGSAFFAAGSQSYVAGAALGHAIGEGIRANQDFNDCLLASGWRIVDGKSPAAQSAIMAQLNGIKQQGNTCVAEIRNKSIYVPIQAHFSEIGTGHFTMAQLTDKHAPTPTEVHLITRYVDESAICSTARINDYSRIVPAFGPILLQQKASNDDSMILLIQGKLTWGEASQRQKQIQEETAAKLRAVHL